MNSLKRQASKAERYARLRDEMKEKLHAVLASKFAQMGRDETGLNDSLEAVGEEIRGHAEPSAPKRQNFQNARNADTPLRVRSRTTARP